MQLNRALHGIESKLEPIPWQLIRQRLVVDHGAHQAPRIDRPDIRRRQPEQAYGHDDAGGKSHGHARHRGYRPGRWRRPLPSGNLYLRKNILAQGCGRLARGYLAQQTRKITEIFPGGPGFGRFMQQSIELGSLVAA